MCNKTDYFSPFLYVQKGFLWLNFYQFGNVYSNNSIVAYDSITYLLFVKFFLAIVIIYTAEIVSSESIFKFQVFFPPIKKNFSVYKFLDPYIETKINIDENTPLLKISLPFIIGICLIYDLPF